jgi:hypothetical protein
MPDIGELAEKYFGQSDRVGYSDLGWLTPRLVGDVLTIRYDNPDTGGTEPVIERERYRLIPLLDEPNGERK